MRITKITLKNFRSFKEMQTIEFAPLTFFFGPNSVGKSNALLALSYIEHILATGDCNPNYIDKFGPKYLGGFQGLVHKRDKSQEIEIGIEFDKENAIGKTYAYLLDYLETENFQTLKSVSDVNKIAVKFFIAWSKEINSAYVRAYNVRFDDSFVFVASSDPKGRQPFIEYANFLSECLMSSVEEGHSEKCKAAIVSKCVLENKEKYKNVVSSEELQEFDELFDEDGFVTPLHRLLTANKSTPTYLYVPEIKTVVAETGISFKSNIGALPKLNHILETSISLDSEQDEKLAHELLSEIIVSPLDNLYDLLQDTVHIGPLRHIESSLITSHKRVNTHWYDGTAAWPELIKQDLNVIRSVNNWMVQKDKLNLGVGIKARLRILAETIHSVDADFEDRFAVSNQLINKISQAIKSMHQQTSAKNQLLDALNDYFAEHGLDVSLVEALREFDDDREDNIHRYVSDLFANFNLDENLSASHVFSFLLYLVESMDENTSELHHHADELRGALSSLGNESFDFTLWDATHEITVQPSDIGVGLSQLQPLIIAAHLPSTKLVSVEQPELHVHPRIQTSTADLLITCAKKRSFLVETHSEHLLLRLIKRIRQTTDNELPDEKLAVRPDDVSVVYFQSTDDGVFVKRIRLDEDGEFVDKWPHGFFSERREEYL